MRGLKQEPEVILAKSRWYLTDLRHRLSALGWSEDDIAEAVLTAERKALGTALQPGAEDFLIY